MCVKHIFNNICSEVEEPKELSQKTPECSQTENSVWPHSGVFVIILAFLDTFRNFRNSVLPFSEIRFGHF